jgi:hypothetical protein
LNLKDHLKNGKKKGENQKRCHLTQLHQVGNCVVAFATASLTGGVEGLSWGFKFSGGVEAGLVSEVSDLVASEGSNKPKSMVFDLFAF